jgi:hypothetical protein
MTRKCRRNVSRRHLLAASSSTPLGPTPRIIPACFFWAAFFSGDTFFLGEFFCGGVICGRSFIVADNPAGSTRRRIDWVTVFFVLFTLSGLGAIGWLLLHGDTVTSCYTSGYSAPWC